MITSYKAGAKYGQVNILSADTYQKLINEKVDVNAAASGTIKGVKIAVESKTTKEKEDIEKFSKEYV